MPNTDRLVLEIRRSAKPFAMLVVFAAVAVTAMAIAFHNLTFERPWVKYDNVKVAFSDVKGIFPKGHQVRIHGVKVGVVKDAKLKDGRAVLTLSIEHKYGPIYRDAKLRIRPVTPLDDLYVNVVDRGHPAAGKAGGDYIIPESDTVSPVDISRVLDVFNADTRERMTILLSELGRALPDGGAKLRASFNALAPFLTTAKDATTVLQQRQKDVKQLVHNFGTLSSALASRDQDINRFVTAGDQTLGQLAANDRPLGETFSQIAQLLPVMRSSFASVDNLSGQLDPALRGLKPVTASLQSGLQGLQKFGKSATPALTALQPAVRDLRGMAQQLNPTAKSLSDAFGRLEPQAGNYAEIVRLVDGCTVRLNRFFGNTMSILQWGDANGAYPRADETVDLDSSGGAPGINTRHTPECTELSDKAR